MNNVMTETMQSSVGAHMQNKTITHKHAKTCAFKNHKTYKHTHIFKVTTMRRCKEKYTESQSNKQIGILIAISKSQRCEENVLNHGQTNESEFLSIYRARVHKIVLIAKSG